MYRAFVRAKSGCDKWHDYEMTVAPYETKKPIYYLEYLPKIFGNFIKKFYPSMYLKDLDQLLTLDFSNTELSPEQKNFCQEFSYDPTENPSETIEKLFKY